MIRTLLAVGIGAMALWANMASGAETRGKVEEMGTGRFRLAETNDLRRLFHVARKHTAYEPDHWRPEVGDSVRIAYSEVARRSGKILRADKVTLLEAGPNTVLLTSPAEGIIEETGRTGYRVRIEGVRDPIRFLTHRATKTVPVGWLPVAGERIRIVFRTEEATFAFGINRIADQAERLPPPEGEGTRD